MSHLFDEGYDNTWRYERFLTTIQQQAGMSWAEAERAARAVLETLGERSSLGQAQDLAGDLPEEMRPWLLDHPPDAEGFDAREFVRRVAEREDTDLETAERHSRAVFVALARLVRGDEIADLLSELPKDYERLLGQAVGGSRDASGAEVLPHEEFLERVSRRIGTDRTGAQRATEAVLETLAERIAGGEVDDLAAELPPELRPALELGKAHSGGKARKMSLDEFVERVSRREGVPVEDALDHARAVFATLREALSGDEFSDVLAELPRGYAEALL